MTGKHLIARQKFELRLTRHEAAHEIQQEFGTLYFDRFAPAIEKLFDRLAAGDRLIRIAKLEVDLGTVSRRELSADAFTAKLVKILKAAMVDATGCPTKATVQPLSQGRFESWLYFLENGCLPADAALPESQSEWREQILAALTADEKAIRRLQQLLSTRPPALDRLVAQYDGEFLQRLLTLSVGLAHDRLPAAVRKAAAMIIQLTHSQSVRAGLNGITVSARDDPATGWLQALISLVPRLKLDAVSIAAFRSQLLHALEQEITSSSSRDEPLAKPDLWRIAFKQIIPSAELEESSLRAAAAFSSQRVIERAALQPQIRRWETRLWRTILHDALASGQKPDAWKILRRTFHQALEEKVQKPVVKPQPLALEKASAGQDGFHCLNAGVILLHPFLLRFFGKFVLGDGELFKDEWHRHKAVGLLHHLATGEKQAPEYQLVLPKLLCGMPLNAPLDHAIVISDEERVESENLLQAAIEHWGALGSSSPTALREGFLQRIGKLEKRQSGWHLHVEHKALDVLLDRLPWGIGIVKLPWMNEMLRVEWR
jgi:hypothetical protein